MGTARKFLRATRFNSRAREGRDPRKHGNPFIALRFNSRAREGRDSGTFDAGISLLLQGGIRGARCK